MQFYGYQFQADDYTIFKFCHNLKYGKAHLYAKFDDDIFLQYLVKNFQCQNAEPTDRQTENYQI